MTPYRSPEPPPGVRMIGRYQLLGQLARGRLGPVWLAAQTCNLAGGSKCICVKELDRAPGELRHAARLNHRNACQIFQYAPGYLVIEYVRGGLLAQLPREPRLLAGIAQQVRAAVASAHALGIVHGALTAEDVLVSTEGRAVVLGYGTAATRPGASQSREQDHAACDELFADAAGVPLAERAIGTCVAEACALRIQHERALSAGYDGWV